MNDAHSAQVLLRRSRAEQAHIDHLHKLALSLGVDVISSVQQPVSNLETVIFTWYGWELGCNMKETRQTAWYICSIKNYIKPLGYLFVVSFYHV